MTEPVRRVRAAAAAKVMVTGASLTSVLAMTAAMGSASAPGEPGIVPPAEQPTPASVTMEVTTAPTLLTTMVPPTVPAAPSTAASAMTPVAPEPTAAPTPAPILVQVPAPAVAPAPDATTRTSS